MSGSKHTYHVWDLTFIYCLGQNIHIFSVTKHTNIVWYKTYEYCPDQNANYFLDHNIHFCLEQNIHMLYIQILSASSSLHCWYPEERSCAHTDTQLHLHQEEILLYSDLLFLIWESWVQLPEMELLWSGKWNFELCG